MLKKAAIALDNGRIDKAIALAEQAEPCAERSMALAAAYKAMADDDHALEYLTEAWGMSKEPEVAHTYGSELVRLGRHAEAVEVLEGFKEIPCRMALGQAYIGLSEIDKACEVYRSIIDELPEFLPAYMALAPLMTHDVHTPCSPARLERFIDDYRTPAASLPALHSHLGKVYEDLGEYERAFVHYSKAAEMRRKELPEGVIENHKAQLEAVKRHFTRELLADVPPQKERCPLVFVFGMPRSGTTLTEQILVAHHEIETLGESPNVMDEIAAIQSGDFDADDPDAATRLYIQRRIGELRSRFVVDKMCGNWQYLGLLYQLFPAARFVYVKRDALNNCFATWSTLFAHGHAYSYTFEEMAAEYRIHEEYMRHWFDVLPEGTIHQVNYEELVTDREWQTKRLLDYIGVAWDDACMQPEKVRRDVKTASLAQVVRPVYTSSIDRAARFGSLLDPLREALA